MLYWDGYTTGWYDGRYYYFYEKETDDDGKENGSLSIGFAVVDILLPVAPKAKEGKAGIHEDMHHLVKT